MAVDDGEPGDRRASDADRERVANLLRDQVAEGRLTYDDLEERVKLAYESRTVGDLELVTRDLPAWAGPSSPEPRDLGRLQRSLRVHWAVWLVFAILLLVVWCLAGVFTGAWFSPVWVGPIGFMGVWLFLPLAIHAGVVNNAERAERERKRDDDLVKRIRDEFRKQSPGPDGNATG